MSFAGVVLICWLAIAAAAFFALGRLASRGDVEADLGIVGETELRMLLGAREEEHLPLESRLAQLGLAGAPQLGLAGAQPVWASHERGVQPTGYTA